MKLVSFDVTLKFGDDVPFDVNMSPQEVFTLLQMPSMCDCVRKLIPRFGLVDELSEMPKKEG